MKISTRTGGQIFHEMQIATNQVNDYSHALKEVEGKLGKTSKAYMLLDMQLRAKKKELENLSKKEYTEGGIRLPIESDIGFPPQPNIQLLNNGGANGEII